MADLRFGPAQVTIAGIFIAAALIPAALVADPGRDERAAAAPNATRLADQSGEAGSFPAQTAMSATPAPSIAALRTPRPTTTPSPPTTGTPRHAASALDFAARYDFDVTVDYRRSSARVIERLTATNVSGVPIDGLDLFVLPNFDRYREFELISLVAGGVPVSPTWTAAGANLALPLPAPVDPGDTVEIAIEFELHASDAIHDSVGASLAKARDVLAFLSWYPMLSEGHGVRITGDPTGAQPTSEFTFRIRSSTPLVIAAPGQLTKSSATEVRGRVAQGRDLAFAVSPGFVTSSGRSAEGVAVTAYATSRELATTARRSAVGALDRFAKLLATPYPASRLIVVEASMDMESSGLVFIDSSHLADPYIVSHEVAHEWFHWLVGNAQLREPWIDEALAVYLANGLKPRRDEGFCSRKPVNSSVYAFANADGTPRWRECEGYIQTVYYKGSWMVDALRDRIGDRPFFAGLRAYLEAFRFQVVTTREVLDFWRGQSPAVTDAFLAKWFALPASPGRPTGPSE